MLRRTLSIMHKEFLHIFRDPRTLSFAFLIPIIQLFLLGYAATTDVEHLSTAVLDYDQTQKSRELIATYQASNYFEIVRYPKNRAELNYLVDSGQVRAGFIIPAGYGRDLARGEPVRVSFLIDGSDPMVSQTAFAAAQSVGQAKSIQIMEEKMGIDLEEKLALKVEPRVLYNPNMESANFMIPGLIGMILQMLTFIMTAMAIVREKEEGTIEQLIVTPIKPYELIIGKVVPYTIIAFFDLLEILALGVLWFQVPIHGSIPLLLSLSGLFLLSSLGIGLFISTTARSQREAMFSTMLVILPSMFLSGYFFPIEAMPVWLQPFSNLIPLTYALIIIRGIILKGVGLTVLKWQVLTLSIFGLVILALASVRFRKKLE